MEKFKVLEKITVTDKNLYLLNKPFRQRMKEDDFHERMYSGTISSYHDPLLNEADWLIYPTLSACNINIISSSETYTFEEALLFTAQSNGFGLSRDNLFSLWELFPEKLSQFKKIMAFMGSEFLPDHSDGPKIAPMLTITTPEPPQTIGQVSRYDWYWIEKHEFDITDSFVFFTPTLTNPYRY